MIRNLNIKKSRSGFTLIEMLIVIAIIGILASVVLVGLGPVQRRGRDARRISDLKNVQNALELYFNKCGYYPGGLEAGAVCGSFTQIPYTDTNWGAELVPNLIGSNLGVRQIPNDPSSGRSYSYATDADGVGYIVGAVLEDEGNPALRDDIDGDVYGVPCDDPMYCVQF